MMTRLPPLTCALWCLAACADGPETRRSTFLARDRAPTATRSVTDASADAGGLDASPPDLRGDAPDPPGVDAGPMTDVDSGEDAGPTPSEPERYPHDTVLSPLSPRLVQRLQGIAATDPSLSDDVFSKIGASTSVSSGFLKCFAGNAFDLDVHTRLRSTRDFFASGDAGGGDPFSRSSLAAKGGVSAGWALSGSPSPLEQELSAASPRFALVHYGTNDLGLGATHLSALFPFAENMWRIIDLLIDRGVIPVLATIQRRRDDAAADLWVPTFNGVIRGLAEGRQIPLVDMWLANEDLPNHGLASDGVHSASYPGGACVLTPEGLRYGMNNRNLYFLSMLSRLEAAVLDGEPGDPPQEWLSGLGTADDPIRIPGLPFHDLRDTREAASDALDMYGGCAATQDERGPEFIYALDISATTRLRITVHDLGATDVDVHLLDETASTEGCLARHHQVIEATLAPGRWHLALDTFVSPSGDERGGEYLLSVIPCPTDDPDCG